jgi:hypothetical protein
VTFIRGCSIGWTEKQQVPPLRFGRDEFARKINKVTALRMTTLWVN